MCGPAAFLAASLALSLVQTVVSYTNAQAQANAQVKYQEDLLRENQRQQLINAEEAIKEQVEQTAAERIGQMQDRDVASASAIEQQRKYMQAEGSALSGASFGGGALNTLMGDYERAYGINVDAINQQLKMQGIASNVAVSSYRDQAISRIRTQGNYIASPVEQPSALVAGLGFGASALGTYGAITSFGKNPLFDAASSTTTTSTTGMTDFAKHLQ